VRGWSKSPDFDQPAILSFSFYFFKLNNFIILELQNHTLPMNRVANSLFSIFIFSLIIFSSCDDENLQEPAVIAEEVLFVSGEKARFLGRIVSNQSLTISDHGFYISDNEGFNSPQIVSLGDRNTPGRFIGEISGLKIQQDYFVKAFIKIGEQLIFSDINPLKTLSPRLEGFTPSSGLGGDVININGSNFTQDTKVFFGEREVQVLKITFESLIQVRVPAIQNKATETIKVISQGKELNFSIPFEYVIGKYKKISNLPFPEKIYDNISMLQDDQLYIGLGTLPNNSLNSKIWRYNIKTDNWSEIPFSGQSSFMSFSSRNYFGGGISVVSRPPFTFSRAFWTFQNNNFGKLPDLPFDNAKSLAFETENGLYVMGGETGGSKFVMFYDKVIKNWRRLPDAPFIISNETLNFHYMGDQYFINGENNLFKYQLSNNTWTLVSKFPGNTGLGGGLALVMDDRVYLGMGNRSKDLWQLNMKTLNWVKKNDFIGSTFAKNVGAFTNGGLLYFVRSTERELSGPMELWSFNPNEF
jgi:hypothetical protein